MISLAEMLELILEKIGHYSGYRCAKCGHSHHTTLYRRDLGGGDGTSYRLRCGIHGFVWHIPDGGVSPRQYSRKRARQFAEANARMQKEIGMTIDYEKVGRITEGPSLEPDPVALAKARRVGRHEYMLPLPEGVHRYPDTLQPRVLYVG